MKTKIKLKNLKNLGLRFKRKQYRVGLIALGIFATVFIGFSFWFRDHALNMVEEMVKQQSQNRLTLKIGKFRFNWLNNKMEIRDAVLYSSDSSAPTNYKVAVKHIAIKARGILPLLFKSELLIDSIHLFSPDIIFSKTNQQAADEKKAHKDSLRKADTLNIDKKFSVAEEMGRISRTINNVIAYLKINQFHITDGSFSLIDKVDTTAAPFVVNKVNIRLDNLQVDSVTSERKILKKEKRKILFTDNIAIQTSNQNITFPDGRHFLSFKNFKVNIQNKRIEFDSCTIRANKGDSSRSAFKIVVDKLQMTNIDFDKLYNEEIIKADSVFATNPKIFLDVDADRQSNKGSDRKPIQNVDQLMQQLLGDVILNYVVVKNADVDIKTIKKGKESSFFASNSNFELQGLQVLKNYEHPIRLERLLLTLHNYETQLADGRYSLAFDSVMFTDGDINLTNFRFKEFSRGAIINNIFMPRFELRDLSWESLLYEQVFSANNATFIRPNITYTIRKKSNRPKSIFETLGELHNTMNLGSLAIHNGNLQLHLAKGATLNLQNTTLSLFPDELTASKKIKHITNSLKAFNFNKGIYSGGGTKVTLNNVTYNANRGIIANSLVLNAPGVTANATNANIHDIILDSAIHTMSVTGMSWEKADIAIKNTPQKNKKKNLSILDIKNIHGKNTSLLVEQNGTNISGVFNTIAVDKVSAKPGNNPEIYGLSLDGNNFLVRGKDSYVSIANMNITDKNSSVLNNIIFKKENKKDSIFVQLPTLTIIPDITKIINGKFYLDNIVLADPVIKATIGKKDSNAVTTNKKQPEIFIGRALFQRPKIELKLENKDSAISYIRWNGVKENSFVALNNFESTKETPIKSSRINIFLTNFYYTNAKGKTIATNDNKLNLQFDDVIVDKTADSAHVSWQTSASILSMDKLMFDSLGKNSAVLNLNKGDIKNVMLHSKYISNVADIIKNSAKLSITGTTGNFVTQNNTFTWDNLNFQNNYFTLDSFSLVPHQSIEEYKIKKAFDADYLRVHTGLMKGGPFDLVKYMGDSILKIRSIEVNDVDLLTFKDKTQEDTLIKYKPLLTPALAKLNTKIDVDSAKINNMNVQYWEINPKTDTLGIIPVSNMHTVMYHIKNHNIQPTDSLYLYTTALVNNRMTTHLQVAESYADTLGGLIMRLQTGPLALTTWNNVLIPLVGAEVISGNLDSLSMIAFGNDHYSKGTMQMYYSQLKLRLLSKKDKTKQTFINKIVSWAANVFIIRKNNKGKESLVFFERLKDKSPINFVIKTSLSGIKSSIGLPGNKGKQRRYFKKANQKNHSR